MLTRRQTLTTLLAAATAAAAPVVAEADATLRLGAIAGGPPIAPESPLGKILIGALADLGYAAGRNLSFETRGAMAQAGKLPGLIAELRAQGVQVFIAAGYPPAAAAKAAGVSTVIFVGAGDPVATGLIESWAHPGGVVTGISDDAATLTVKRLDFLKAFSPNLKRVAMLWNADDRAMTLRYQVSAATAQTRGLVVQPLGVREPDDFNGAFEAMDRDKTDAILMVSDGLMILNRKRVLDFAVARRLPAIYESDNYARDGGLMSYGADPRESLVRAASMIDQIFRGAKPGDIPFEQPTRYLFVVNLKTARAIGLEPPVTLLAAADEVIE
jgi:putative tryptophan/tyrosine transport system substrate-binding protein